MGAVLGAGRGSGGPMFTSWSSARRGFRLAFATENRGARTEEGDYGGATGKERRRLGSSFLLRLTRGSNGDGVFTSRMQRTRAASEGSGQRLSPVRAARVSCREGGAGPRADARVGPAAQWTGLRWLACGAEWA